jgi:hypothetical protein
MVELRRVSISRFLVVEASVPLAGDLAGTCAAGGCGVAEMRWSIGIDRTSTVYD